jgi:single-strand DNA-binding protein
MNKVILCGNLGEDAELKYTQGGQAVARIRLCTSKKWVDKDGKKQERPEWHTCNWWGKGAEAVAQYMLKGNKILLEGELQTRSWDDKDGNKRYSTEVNVHNVELLTPKNSGQSAGNAREDQRRQARAAAPKDYDEQTGEVYQEDDSDVPF